LHDVELGKSGWDFFEIALGYLAKAFFATDAFEALLWNICTIEALFGDTDRYQSKAGKRDIKYYLGQVLENKRRERARLREMFKEIYEHRNVLVHAKHYNRQIEGIHINDARNFARRSAVWFLERLQSLHAKNRAAGVPAEQYPRKKQILEEIDRMD
jgi:hypothetical protein